MASKSNMFGLVLAVVLATLLVVESNDPDILSDFVVPPGVVPDASFFTFRGLRNVLLNGAPSNATFKVTKVSNDEFSALNGQSVSCAVLQYGPGGINGPHTHPRSAELLIVLQGWLKVGFIDSTNKLFTQILQTGDVFVFPEGLVHFQENLDLKYPAVALAALGSANSGAVVLSRALFASNIDNAVLAKSFKVESNTIQKIINANTA